MPCTPRVPPIVPASVWQTQRALSTIDGSGGLPTSSPGQKQKHPTPAALAKVAIERDQQQPNVEQEQRVFFPSGGTQSLSAWTSVGKLSAEAPSPPSTTVATDHDFPPLGAPSTSLAAHHCQPLPSSPISMENQNRTRDVDKGTLSFPIDSFWFRLIGFGGVLGVFAGIAMARLLGVCGMSAYHPYIWNCAPPIANYQ